MEKEVMPSLIHETILENAKNSGKVDYQGMMRRSDLKFMIGIHGIKKGKRNRVIKELEKLKLIKWIDKQNVQVSA